MSQLVLASLLLAALANVAWSRKKHLKGDICRSDSDPCLQHSLCYGNVKAPCYCVEMSYMHEAVKNKPLASANAYGCSFSMLLASVVVN